MTGYHILGSLGAGAEACLSKPFRVAERLAASEGSMKRIQPMTGVLPAADQ